MDQDLHDLMSGGFEKDALKEIRKLLDEELGKPAHKRNYDIIEELTDVYSDLTGMESFIQEATERGVQKLTGSSDKKPVTRMRKRMKVLIIAACIAAMIAIANVITVAAWNMDVFSVIIHYYQNGFSVDFDDTPTAQLPASEGDPYGIKGECAKYEISVEAPSYLPEGFVLDEYGHTDRDSSMTCTFHFRMGKQYISIVYESFDDEERMHDVKVPSDDFNLSEIEVNGKTAIVSKEDHQYTILWRDTLLLCSLMMKDVPYEECDKIVDSLQ